MIRRALLLLVVVALVGGAAWVLWRRPPETGGYQGYVEGNLVLVAPETTGRIETLAVDTGSTVAAGQALFALETSMEAAQLREAKAKLQQARAQLANLEAAL